MCVESSCRVRVQVRHVRVRSSSHVEVSCRGLGTACYSQMDLLSVLLANRFARARLRYDTFVRNVLLVWRSRSRVEVSLKTACYLQMDVRVCTLNSTHFF